MSYFEAYKGTDGKVSPEDWNLFYQEWVNQGYKATDFVDNFGNLYINQSSKEIGKYLGNEFLM